MRVEYLPLLTTPGGAVFPAGVLTRDIEVGPAADAASGAFYSIRVLVESSRSLVWNGTPVFSKLKEYRFKPNEAGVITLPVTNQAGYRDTKGSLISLGAGEHTHYYKIRVYYLRNGAVAEQNTGIKAVLPSGSGAVDVDELIQFTSERAGSTISAPDEWSALVASAEAAALAATAAAETVAENIENLESFVGESVQDWFDAHSGTVVSPQVLDTKLAEHKNESAPHKAYDIDLPSLTIHFENGLA